MCDKPEMRKHFEETAMSKCVEELSALMDGEASELEIRRVLKSVDESPELTEKWRRYQMARSVMRGERQLCAGDISAQVALALESEPCHETVPPSADSQDGARPTLNGFWRSIASMAVAASVTAIVILGANSFNGGAPQPSPATPSVASAKSPEVYSAPSAPVSSDLIRAQFGNRVEAATQMAPQGSVIRLSQGLKRYIDQHEQMLTVRQPKWQTSWVPEGYHAVKHEMLPHGEVIMYSNGDASFSVTIEDQGYQRSAPGVAQADGLVAVGRKEGDHFVTVVGDLPLMIADRIASNISMVR